MKKIFAISALCLALAGCSTVRPEYRVVPLTKEQVNHIRARVSQMYNQGKIVKITNLNGAISPDGITTVCGIAHKKNTSAPFIGTLSKKVPMERTRFAVLNIGKTHETAQEVRAQCAKNNAPIN